MNARIAITTLFLGIFCGACAVQSEPSDVQVTSDVKEQNANAATTSVKPTCPANTLLMSPPSSGECVCGSCCESMYIPGVGVYDACLTPLATDMVCLNFCSPQVIKPASRPETYCCTEAPLHCSSVNLLWDDAHCGACSNACDTVADEYCYEGRCVQ